MGVILAALLLLKAKLNKKTHNFWKGGPHFRGEGSFKSINMLEPEKMLLFQICDNNVRLRL